MAATGAVQKYWSRAVDGLVEFCRHGVVLLVRLRHAAVGDFRAPAVGHLLAKGFLGIDRVAVSDRARLEPLRELVADADRRERVGRERHDVFDEKFVHIFLLRARCCENLASVGAY